ncbi:MAG: hypothetical protein JSS43_28455 [Proteobacteria bacterium]|nr:hypothetical protein [Pseudomonadota bacterium]
MSRDEDGPPPGSPWRALVGLIVLVLAALGVWYMVQQLQKSATLQDCFASGRTNCAPINAR